MRSKAWLLFSLALAALGCRQDMHDQPKFRGLRGNDFFDDGRSARPLPAGTVHRDGLREDDHLHRGKVDGRFATEFPFPVGPEVLARGRERFDIFCSPCHGGTGDGLGMAVRRGMTQPTSFHIDRLRNAEAGYLFDVISNGFGRMQDYSAQVPVRDRWAIVAYVRALQLSQNATLDDVPADQRGTLAGNEAQR